MIWEVLYHGIAEEIKINLDSLIKTKMNLVNYVQEQQAPAEQLSIRLVEIELYPPRTLSHRSIHVAYRF